MRSWVDYHGNVRNTYGNSGDGEILEVDKYILELLYGKGNVKRITSLERQKKGGDWECTDKNGNTTVVDTKGDHYPNPINILLEAMDGYKNGWLKTNSSMKHITDQILYIRYNAETDFITFDLLDYEYLTRIFLYTDTYRDRIFYRIGDKTIGSYFRNTEIPSEPKFYPEIGKTIKPRIRTGRIPKSVFSKEVQNKIIKYTADKHTMSDYRKYFNYSIMDNPNDKKELEQLLGENSSASKRALLLFEAEKIRQDIIKNNNRIFCGI